MPLLPPVTTATCVQSFTTITIVRIGEEARMILASLSCHSCRVPLLDYFCCAGTLDHSWLSVPVKQSLHQQFASLAWTYIP
jgi:hypothetical protein